MSEPKDPKLPLPPRVPLPFPPEEEFPEERPTGILCEACGGEPERLSETATGVRMSRCAWCENGVMTPSQLRKFRAREKK